MDPVPVASLGALADLDHLDHLDGTRGAVVAVFETAVYATAGGEHLLVVHETRHGHTPTSVLADRARPLEWGIRVGDVVAGRGGRLRVGPVVLDARGARRWVAAPPAPGRLSAGEAARESVALARLLAERAPGTLERLGAPLASLTAALAHARDDARDHARAHAELSAAAARRLVGAGPGLTPSGDDALVGLLAVLHRVAPSGRARAALTDLARVLPPLLARTTAISAHYLRLALAGAFGEHLIALVDAVGGVGGVGGVATAHDDAAGAAVSAVLATGATSGADALAGVVAGLALLAGGSPVALEEVA